MEEMEIRPCLGPRPMDIDPVSYCSHPLISSVSGSCWVISIFVLIFQIKIKIVNMYIYSNTVFCIDVLHSLNY